MRMVDVRFIAASNRDLHQAVRERVLREDFFYRINVFPIVIPPLRERIEDIPVLCESFLQRRHPGVRVSAEALELLGRYPWPGNIRELENTLERAVIMAHGTGGALCGAEQAAITIGVRHLPPSVCESATALPTSTLLRPGFSIDQLERSLIQEALARASGNKTEAARLLGITRRRLYSRLKSMAADAAEERSEELLPEPDAVERVAAKS
jgi:transcriptional regulator with GAF, ATPase, and Fis domain